MFIENFHHLYDLLSQLKISVLDHERKEAKQKYQEALKAYVTRYFGRPLEKLNVNIKFNNFIEYFCIFLMIKFFMKNISFSLMVYKQKLALV